MGRVVSARRKKIGCDAGCGNSKMTEIGRKKRVRNILQHLAIEKSTKKREPLWNGHHWAGIGMYENREVQTKQVLPPPPSLTPLFRGSVLFIEGISLSIIAVYANITNSLRAGSLIWEILARNPNATEELEHTGPTFLSCSSFPTNLVISPLV